MPRELDLSVRTIAEGLKEWKSEDEIWGAITLEMKAKLKELLEGVLEVERDRLVACEWYQRTQTRRDERAGYRPRTLVTALGKITGLRVPRMRKKRFQTRLWHYYKRRATPIERAVMESFLCGVATRKVKRALRSILGNGVPSHQAVSRVVAGLNRSLKEWQARPIEDDIEILYLDGVYLRIKERGIKKRPTLFAMGITKDRKVRILAFQHAWQESADEWQSFTQSLFERGLKGSSLRAVVVDEAAAIAGAVALLWPEALLQVCMFHKMRNLVMSIKRSPLKKLIITDARAIWKTTSRADAIAMISRFRHKWAKSHPKAVRNLLRNIDLTLSYLSLPPPMWVKARTTNLLDRFFREIRRRINPMGPFLDRPSASRILFAIADKYNNDNMEKENRPVKTSQCKSLKITSAHF
jgi:putative transposase